MPSEAMRTHRESLAIVLAILGGAVWLAIPSIEWLGGDLAAYASIVAGAGLGAAACAFSIPGLSRPTAAVGGAIAAMLVLGLRSLHGHHALTGESAGVAITAAVVALGAAALVPRRLGGSHHAIAAALIASAAIGVTYLAAMAIPLNDHGRDDGWLVLLIFGAPLIGGLVTGLLLPGADPITLFTGWLYLLGASAVLAVALTFEAYVLVIVLAGGLGFLMIFGGTSSLGVAIAIRFRAARAARPDLPAARVVDP